MDRELTREAVRRELELADATARKILAGGLPVAEDEALEASKRTGRRSAHAHDAIYEYSLDDNALEFAGRGYAQAGLVLGMALMYRVLNAEKGDL
jgi:hypothetical protein